MMRGYCIGYRNKVSPHLDVQFTCVVAISRNRSDNLFTSKSIQNFRKNFPDCTQLNEHCSLIMESFAGIQISDTDIIETGGVPLNELIVVPMPTNCCILEIFEVPSSPEDKHSPTTPSISWILDESQEESIVKKGIELRKEIIQPCRRSKRLMDKHYNHKCISVKRATGASQPQQPKTNKTDLKTEICSSPTKSTPKAIVNTLSLKTLCVPKIVRRKKQEYMQQKLKHSDPIEKSGTDMNKDEGKNKDKDSNDDEDSLLHFGDTMANLKPLKPKVGIMPVGIWEEYVKKRRRYGTVTTLSTARTHGSSARKRLITTADFGLGKWEWIYYCKK